jgi:hypothetical protein
MIKPIFWAVACAFIGLGGPLWAASGTGVLYDCDITDKKDRQFWISDKIAIVITGAGDVVVSDQVILYFKGLPVAARVTRNTDSKMDIRWTLRDLVNDANQRTPAFEYSATLTKATNRIAVYGKPDGYSDRFSGKGQCTTRRG